MLALCSESARQRPAWYLFTTGTDRPGIWFRPAPGPLLRSGLRQLAPGGLAVAATFTIASLTGGHSP